MELWRMKTLMKILCLFVVFSSVLMKSGDVFEGTVGEKVEITCLYSDGYTYTPKYLCRDPCSGSQHVLIKSEKTDQVVSDGRYSLINTASTKFFTVIIKDLRLKDAGVYYCGVDKWFKDTVKKVHLSVHQAAPVNRPSHTSEKTITTTSTWTTTLTSTENSHSYELLPPTVPSSGSTPLINSSVDVTAVCAGVLSFLVFWILVALVFIYRKRSAAKFR
ncbi:hypothetical protein PO909_018296 [Leuciscus waleckii]